MIVASENIEKLCNFFGYYITRVNNEHTFYTIESRYGITDVTDVIYEDFSEILYHITNKKNINKIFKKDRILQARIFYFLLGISMIYLVTNFIFDIFSCTKLF